MAESIDIDGLMKSMADPKTGKNMETVLDMMKEVNRVLKEVQHTVDFLDRSGVKPMLIRLAGKKFDIDVETPLRSEAQGFTPSSKLHENIFNQLNSMSQQQLTDMFSEQIQEVAGELKQAEIEEEEEDSNAQD